MLKPDGIDQLKEQIRRQACPLQSEEASALFIQAQLWTGPRAKQQGELCLHVGLKRW